MMRLNPLRYALTAILVVAADGPAATAAEHPHEHGVGHLDMALDGATLSVRLTAPADTFVGFERAPETDAERERVRAARATLADAAALYQVNAEAGCDATKASEERASHDTHDGGHHAHQHSDWHTDHSWVCSTPAALRSVTVTAFDPFARFERIEVQFTSDRGQTAATLTPAAPVFELP